MPITGIYRNLWATTQHGLLAPKRMNFPIDSLELYLPLWHPELSGSPIISKDLNAISSTVTGATHGITGRTFDALDDVIVVDASSAYEDLFVGGGTAVFWINPASDGEGDLGHVIETKANAGWVLNVQSEAAGKVELRFIKWFDGTVGVWSTTATEVTIGTFAHVVITYNDGAVGNNPIIYIDGVAKTVGDGLTEDSTPIGTTMSDSGTDMRIGDSSSSTRGFDGTIGEEQLHKSKVFTQANVDQHRDTTKWRYV